MRVLECQLSANFLAYSQPSVNLNKTQLTFLIKFTLFFDIFDNSQRFLRNHSPAACECTATSTMF